MEISSDEESVSNVWSIERSASQPSDLSKTPYVASTLKGSAQQSPVNLCNKADDCSRSSTNSIPPQSLVTSSSRIITYEKAKQAMSVLCYPSSTSPFCNEESSECLSFTNLIKVWIINLYFNKNQVLTVRLVWDCDFWVEICVYTAINVFIPDCLAFKLQSDERLVNFFFLISNY